MLAWVVHSVLGVEWSTETSKNAEIPICARLRVFAPVLRVFAPALRLKLPEPLRPEPQSASSPKTATTSQHVQHPGHLEEDGPEAPN